MEQINTGNNDIKRKRSKIMEKVNTIATATVGAGAVEVINIGVTNMQDIQQAGGLLIQLAIGIITIIKMLKRKKNEDIK